MFFFYAALVMGLLILAGVLAGYVAPHIRPLERWITQLLENKK